MPTLVTRRAPCSPALRSRSVRTIADRMLAALERQDAELSVLLTNDAFIHELNRTHRGKDRPTDVLAFAQADEDETTPTQTGPNAPSPFANALLGDVVISLDTAARQATARGHALLDEVSFLLAHGILHLVGYDHQTDAEEAEMNHATRRLVMAATADGGHPDP